MNDYIVFKGICCDQRAGLSEAARAFQYLNDLRSYYEQQLGQAEGLEKVIDTLRAAGEYLKPIQEQKED